MGSFDDFAEELDLDAYYPPVTFIRTMTDGKGTVVELDLEFDHTCFHSAGSSRRVKGDVFDRELGERLALARAMEKALRQLKAKNRKDMKALDKKAQS